MFKEEKIQVEETKEMPAANMLGYQQICGFPLYHWRTNDFKHLIFGGK